MTCPALLQLHSCAQLFILQKLIRAEPEDICSIVESTYLQVRTCLDVTGKGSYSVLLPKKSETIRER